MQRRSARDPKATFPGGPVPAGPAPDLVTRPRLQRLAPVLALLAALAVLLASPAAAAPAQDGDTRPRTGYVSVIEVSGLLDRVLVDFVQTEIDEAASRGAVALVLQLNSSGAVVSHDRLEALVEAIEASPVPVDVWVGPSGSQASGEATAVLAAARTVGVAPKSRVEITRTLLGDRRLEGDAAVGDKVGAETAVELGLADNDAPTIGEFVLGLDGVESEVVGEGEAAERRPVTQTRFSQLPLAGQLMHTVASPPVAYLLFAIGLGLLVFELYTAGVGVAGVVGAGSLILGAYGLDVLPARWWAVALLVVSMIGFAIDVQVGVPRFWTGVGVVTLVVGSVWLYEGMSLSWITLLVGILGTCLGMISGMPAMVRTRFSTPTIGREWMIGEMGVAESAVDPDGVVRVRDALWRARTNRATPIPVGGSIRVVEISGLILEVEPEEGAARDYRERRR